MSRRAGSAELDTRLQTVCGNILAPSCCICTIGLYPSCLLPRELTTEASGRGLGCQVVGRGSLSAGQGKRKGIVAAFITKFQCTTTFSFGIFVSRTLMLSAEETLTVCGDASEAINSWTWKPRECTLPEFDAARYLELFRDKNVLFVGDSLMVSENVCYCKRAFII